MKCTNFSHCSKFSIQGSFYEIKIELSKIVISTCIVKIPALIMMHSVEIRFCNSTSIFPSENDIFVVVTKLNAADDLIQLNQGKSEK